MSTYNGEEYVRDAITSVLNQTYRCFELIILDDCSSDQTLEVISETVCGDPRVTIHQNSVRRGMIYTWNKLIEITDPKTRYFAWLSDHDVLSPNWIEELLNIYRDSDNVVLAYARTIAISADGVELLEYTKHEYSIDSNYVLERLYRMFSKDVLYGNMIYGLIDFAVLKDINGYPFVLLPDTVCIWGLVMHGKISLCAKTSWYRRHYDKYSLQRQQSSLGLNVKFYHLPLFPLFNSLTLFRLARRQPIHIRVISIILYLISIGTKQMARIVVLTLRRISTNRLS